MKTFRGLRGVSVLLTLFVAAGVLVGCGSGGRAPREEVTPTVTQTPSGQDFPAGTVPVKAAWVWPEPDSEVSRVDNIMISLTADKPIPREQVEKGFSISPAVKGRLDWVGNVLKYNLEEQPQLGQEVSVVLDYPGLPGGVYRFSFKRQASPGSGFAANVMEHRYWDGTGNAPGHDVKDGDSITVSEGMVSAELYFGSQVDQQAVEAGLVLSRKPDQKYWQWDNRMWSGRETDPKSQLRLFWNMGAAGEEITITITRGTPLGDGTSLEKDFSFRLVRKTPPSFKVELTEGTLPGGQKASWESYAMGDGLYLPIGPKTFRLTFDRDMDPITVERAIVTGTYWPDPYKQGKGAREVYFKWSGTRTLEVAVRQTEPGFIYRIDPSGSRAVDGMVLDGPEPVQFMVQNGGQVWSMGFSGDGPQKIAELDVMMTPGELSPDGKKLIFRETFLQSEDGDGPELYRPWVLDLVSGRLSYWQSAGRWGISSEVRWLNDSKGFLVVSEGNLVYLEYPGFQLRVMAKAGEKTRIVDFAPDPTGQRIAVARYEEATGPERTNPSFTLSVVDIKTGAETILPSPISSWWIDGILLDPPDLTWDSSGKFLLAVDRDQKGYGSLIRIDASTGNKMKSQAKPAGEQGVMRLRSVPGGKRVLVNGSRGSILLDPSSGQSEEVKEIIGWSSSLPSPDGTKVAFQGNDGVEVYDSKSGRSSTLESGVLAGWSPDGDRIIYVKAIQTDVDSSR